jgi:hypothetical protein
MIVVEYSAGLLIWKAKADTDHFYEPRKLKFEAGVW